MICTQCLVHSLAVVEAIVLLVAVGKVAVLEVVDAIVATTSDALVVDVEIAAPILEGVDGKAVVLPVVVTKVAASSKRSTIKQLDSKGLRLGGTELQGLFSWTASRRMRGRRASEVDTSVRLGCQQWSVIDAVKQQLKSRWHCCSTLVLHVES